MSRGAGDAGAWPLVVAVLVAAALVGAALLTGGSDEGSGLRVERSGTGDTPDAELIV